MTVCERIDAVLKERGISRRKAAIMAGISPSTFQSAMQKNGNMSVNMLVPIAKVLHVDSAWLVTGIERSESLLYQTIQVEHHRFNHDLEEPEKEENPYHDISVLVDASDIRILLEQLNPYGRAEAKKRVRELTFIPEYTKTGKGDEQ